MGNNFNSKEYWETRYKNRGNSGAGSYGVEASFKSNYVNSFIKDKMIKKINDFGCGDSNQISFFEGFEQYVGFDVSKTALEICKNKFKNNDKYNFVSDVSEMSPADMTTSFDVTYHIIEDEYFDTYMHNLFKLSNKYVLIYSVNDNSDEVVDIHLKHRNFVEWINKNYPDFKLMNFTQFTKANKVGFYLFEK